MVMARTVAMSANRLLDAELDAKNPRTANLRHPLRKIIPHFRATSSSACCAAFVGSHQPCSRFSTTIPGP